MSEDDETPKKRPLRVSKRYRDNVRARKMITDQLVETTGWSEDKLMKVASVSDDMPLRYRLHYRGELMALAKDMGAEIGVTINNRAQAAFLISAFLASDDDDGDTEAEPEPQRNDDKVPA